MSHSGQFAPFLLCSEYGSLTIFLEIWPSESALGPEEVLVLVTYPLTIINIVSIEQDFHFLGNLIQN